MEYIKQPNGKYCTMPWGGSGVAEFNLTEEEIVERAIEEAKIKSEEAIKNAKKPGEIISRLAHINIKGDDDILKKMGFTEPYEELKKYVPLKPIGQQYASCDFTTYGKCPTCGKTVQDGMGFRQEKCSCGQRLKWE